MKRDPTKQPTSGLYGWGSAETILKRCKNTARRELLTELARQGGVQGAPALGYLARVLRWHADEADAPVAPGKLKLAEVRYVEARAKELLKPYVDARDPRLPGRMQWAIPVETAA